MNPERYLHIGMRELKRIYRDHAARESLESARGGGWSASGWGFGGGRNREPAIAEPTNPFQLAYHLDTLLDGNLLDLEPGTRIDPERFDLRFAGLDHCVVEVYYLHARNGREVSMMIYVVEVRATLDEEERTGLLAMFGSYENAIRWERPPPQPGGYFPSELSGLSHALGLQRGQELTEIRPVAFTGEIKELIATEMAQVVARLRHEGAVLTTPARVRFKVHGVFLPSDVGPYGDLGTGFSRSFDYDFGIVASPLVIEELDVLDLHAG